MIEQAWVGDEQDFLRRREEHLLYS
jgi:hypothetical protein